MGAITDAGCVAEAVARYRRRRQEHVLALTLNASHEIIHTRVVSIGTVNQCQVTPRDVYYYAIKDNSTAVIIVHNHPTGHTQPSGQDDELTRTMAAAGKILGITLLDHVIIGPKGKPYSYQSAGRMG